MSKGNINGAIKLLSDNMADGIVPLNDETLEILRQKHPEPQKELENSSLPSLKKMYFKVLVRCKYVLVKKRVSKQQFMLSDKCFLKKTLKLFYSSTQPTHSTV